MKNVHLFIQKFFVPKNNGGFVSTSCKYFLCVSVIALCAGCSLLPGKAKTKEGVPKAKLVSPLNTGKIVNAALLKEGGDLLIVPFSAGANVSADEELDSIALRIVQGIAHRLKDNKPYFNVLLADNAEDASLFIEGHITKLYKPSFFAYWFFGKRKNIVAVSGRLTTRNTGEAIVIFNYKVKSDGEDNEFADLGFKVGKNIGDFILSGIN